MSLSSLAWAAALGYSAAHWWPGLPLRPTLVALAVLSASRLAADVAAMWRSPLDAVERPLNATRRTRWRNLGLWPPDGSGGYAAACSALAERVGDMAGVGASTRAVLDVGCGAGESLRIWSARGAALVVGVDAAPPVDCSSAVECCDAAGVGAYLVLSFVSETRVLAMDSTADELSEVELPGFDADHATVYCGRWSIGVLQVQRLVVVVVDAVVVRRRRRRRRRRRQSLTPS